MDVKFREWAGVVFSIQYSVFSVQSDVGRVQTSPTCPTKALDCERTGWEIIEVSKRHRITEMVAPFAGGAHDPHYLAFFDYFNRGLFYEAHDVLENLWLPLRKSPEGDFYKGLIQLAGAFVHLQKNRLKPAAALFELARANLLKYGGFHQNLPLSTVHDLIGHYAGALRYSNFSENPLAALGSPRLLLMER